MELALGSMGKRKTLSIFQKCYEEGFHKDECSSNELESLKIRSPPGEGQTCKMKQLEPGTEP